MPRSGYSDNIPKGIAIIVTAMIVFATQDAIVKHLAQSYHPLHILWVRFLFLPVFAVAMCWRRGGIREGLRSSRPGLQIVRSLMLLADMFLFVIVIKIMPLADAHAIVAIFPLMVIALSALFLGEEVGLRRWTAVLVGFLGVLVIIRPGFSVIQPGAVLALVMSGFFSIYTVMTRAVSRSDSTETSMLYVAIVGLIGTTAVGPFFWVNPAPGDWIWLVILSISGAVGHFLLIMALDTAPASVLQPYNYILLLWATLMGFLIFGHLPDLWTVAGAAIIVGSGLYAFMRERQLKKADSVAAPGTGVAVAKADASQP